MEREGGVFQEASTRQKQVGTKGTGWGIPPCDARGGSGPHNPLQAVSERPAGPLLHPVVGKRHCSQPFLSSLCWGLPGR